MLKILGFILFIPLYIVVVMYSGIIFSFIWLWFAVPLGLAVLSIPHSLGLMALVNFPLTGIYFNLAEINPTEQTLANNFSRLIMMAAFVSAIWGYSYIVHSFM